MKGHDPSVLIDRLGSRLAFERTGFRLYDGFLLKVETSGEQLIDLEVAKRIQREELEHFVLVREAIEILGGDPTAVTPGADADAIASLGLEQLVRDPRSTIDQTLHAIHIAELADSDAWEILVQLSRKMGLDELADRFEVALHEEEVHLAQVRKWMKDLLSRKARVDLQ